MTPYGSGVSRRGLLAMLAVLGAAGCARGRSDEERPDDPYITAIKADPMFTWAPSGSSIRDVAYAPMITTQPMPSRTSDVIVTYYTSDAASLAGLVQRAKDDSLSYGYSKEGKHFVEHVLIALSVGAASDHSGIYLHFQAPVG